MNLSTLLPNVRALSRTDKMHLIRIVSEELERDEGKMIKAGQTYPVWSPETAFTAADALLRAFEEDKANS